MATTIDTPKAAPIRSVYPSSPTTPTYSGDRARLTASHPDGEILVNSYSEARVAMEGWAVLGPGSPLRRRVKLDTDDDWKNFIDSILAKEIDYDGGVPKIDLEAVLKRCYEVAFYMPPSPSASARRTPEFGAQPHAGGSLGRVSPAPLTI
uniref:Uncharacterized protein n=1 Tax=Pseudictyota dubia TaxID=2749911 RepID=A0A7R9ZE25_9STRA|mmetsp:Transcript_41933/g.77639  ORF Transcript_41933/g.77639 Transcript_41933/m.77639 type:complete len:150 (+) Transcript_41933:40-489(+)